MNGEYLGETPYTHKDTKTVFTSNKIELKKEGYETKEVRIRRDGKVNVGALIGGIFVLFPFIWLMDYKSTYNFELEPVKS